MVAKIDLTPPIVTTASEAEVNAVLARVLSSRHFVHAPKKQKFLRVICEFYLRGRAHELNEYLIGRDVFERDDSYNPSADPIVRVGAHDIRKKLDLYYQTEGADDDLRLIVPVGSYEPAFVRGAVPLEALSAANGLQAADALETSEEPTPVAFSEAVMVDPVVPIRTPVLSQQWLWGLLALAALLVVLVAGLLLANRSLERQLEERAARRPAPGDEGLLWQPFLNDKTPTLLILSNPSVYRTAHESDPEVITKNGVSLTPEQARELTSRAGNRLPLLADRAVRLIPAITMYTGIGEAIGVYRLAGLLQTAGGKTLLKQSRNVSPEDLKQYNAVLLGSVYSNQWSKPLSIKENFVYTPHATIQNLDPRPGEEREYKPVFDERSGIMVEDFALISVTPGVSDERTIMTLAGTFSEGTQAAAEFVTTANTQHELNQRLQQIKGKAGAPCYYQALLKVHVENAFPTKAILIAFRELQVTNQ